MIDWKGYIEQASAELLDLILEKNTAYGNSALDPLPIYSRADTLERLHVRIDDKLSRLFRGTEYPGDDTLKDLAGYYILLRALELAENAVNITANVADITGQGK